VGKARRRAVRTSVHRVATGRYRIDTIIAAGGMATAYRAHDEELDRVVAVKMLDEGLAGDASFRRRFLREARTAARLAHPNVVQVFDAGEDGVPYIVMELVEGENLAEILKRRRRLPWQEAVDLARQACAALAHAHEHGIVHRDVKPQNLLVRDDGTLKITDFGIARAAEETRLTQAGTILGTAAYLSPEQAAGEEVTLAADLYSLGAVLYEVIGGRPPYELDSFAELAQKQKRGPAPLAEIVPGIPRHVEDAVMRCLARNPEYRPRSAEALADELAPHSRTAATAPLPRPRRRPRLSRRWAAIAVLAALAGAAAIAVGVSLTSDDGRPPRPQPAQIEAPVPGQNAEQGLRNVSEWLRENSR
jgi:eukaryotic-like serine/threonine-protein kinase